MTHKGLIWLASFSLLLGGCSSMKWTPIVKETVSVTPQSPVVVQQDPSGMQNRFSNTSSQQADAVKNAVMWSEKYNELSVKSNELRERNVKLHEENALFKQQLKLLEAELNRTKQELSEANDFLQKMHLELTQWKTDVLGFREEIRRSQAAQIGALTKILRILGAEPVTAAEQ